MALLEVPTAMIMSGTAEAAAPPAAATKAAPPSAELLEFLAEWSDDDAKLLDGETVADAARSRPAAARKTPAAAKPQSPKAPVKGEQ